MCDGVVRVAIVSACLVWLAGCVTTTNSDNPFVKLGAADGASPQVQTGTINDATGAIIAPQAQPGGVENEATGSIAAPQGVPPQTPLDAPPATPELLGQDPNDDLSIGKKYFRQGSYGLAERHFRKAVELHPRDAESWVGLAAAYDRLRRFDLADRAYANAIRLIGRTPELLNNQGFSYLLRGDYRRARDTLLAARAKDPKNPYILNNLKLLEASARKVKAVN